MQKTLIEWVKNPDGTQGYTWNPITGCLNGCPYCYARKLANGRLKQRYLANDNVAIKLKLSPPAESLKSALDVKEALCDPFYPRFWANRWLDLRWQASRGIFVCDMGELFGDWIPKEWQEKVFEYIKCYPKCRFYLLTKQPQNLPKFSPFPENCWVGVTATDGEMYQRAMIYLDQIQAKVKYISFEPILGRIAFFEKPIAGLDWAILGAQTKPYKPPEKKWVDNLVYLFDRYRIPIFVKDNLKPLLGYTVRQEMPE